MVDRAGALSYALPTSSLQSSGPPSGELTSSASLFAVLLAMIGQISPSTLGLAEHGVQTETAAEQHEMASLGVEVKAQRAQPNQRESEEAVQQDPTLSATFAGLALLVAPSTLTLPSQTKSLAQEVTNSQVTSSSTTAILSVVSSAASHGMVAATNGQSELVPTQPQPSSALIFGAAEYPVSLEHVAPAKQSIAQDGDQLAGGTSPEDDLALVSPAPVSETPLRHVTLSFPTIDLPKNVQVTDHFQRMQQAFVASAPTSLPAVHSSSLSGSERTPVLSHDDVSVLTAQATRSSASSPHSQSHGTAQQLTPAPASSPTGVQTLMAASQSDSHPTALSERRDLARAIEQVTGHRQSAGEGGIVIGLGQTHSIVNQLTTEHNGAVNSQIAEQAIDQAFGQIQRALANGTRAVRVRLEPPSLGVVEVRLVESSGVLHITLSSPHDLVRDALARGLDDLRQSLAAHGITVHRVEVATLPGSEPSVSTGSGGWSAWSDPSGQQRNTGQQEPTVWSWQPQQRDSTVPQLLQERPPRRDTSRTVDYWA